MLACHCRRLLRHPGLRLLAYFREMLVHGLPTAWLTYCCWYLAPRKSSVALESWLSAWEQQQIPSESNSGAPFAWILFSWPQHPLVRQPAPSLLPVLLVVHERVSPSLFSLFTFQ